MNSKRHIILPWALTGIVSLLAIYAWGQSFDWDSRAINAYQFFPVLGLLAFSIMWSHYMVGAIRNTVFKNTPLVSYFRYTGYIVLAAIVLHPGILTYRLFHDGFGLPPGSYALYAGPRVEWVVLLGTASLLAFLAFELHRWYAQKPWWKYVVSAGDIAMLVIFYHGLRLGSQLQGGWYHAVWWLYGITLLAALVRKYVLVLQHRYYTETTSW